MHFFAFFGDVLSVCTELCSIVTEQQRVLGTAPESRIAVAHPTSSASSSMVACLSAATALTAGMGTFAEHVLPPSRPGRCRCHHLLTHTCQARLITAAEASRCPDNSFDCKLLICHDAALLPADVRNIFIHQIITTFPSSRCQANTKKSQCKQRVALRSPPHDCSLSPCAGGELAAASAAGRRPRSPVASCRPSLAAGLRCRRRGGADRLRFSVTTVFAGHRSRGWVSPWRWRWSRGPRGPPMCGSLLTSCLCGGHTSPFFSPFDYSSVIHLPLPSLPALKRRCQVCPLV